MFQFRNCFCLCRTADCTGISLHTCCCISCFLCHYTFVIGMFICLCDLFCLCCSADCTGVSLFSCFCAGWLFCYFSFIEDMFFCFKLGKWSNKIFVWCFCYCELVVSGFVCFDGSYPICVCYKFCCLICIKIFQFHSTACFCRRTC